eukprot:7331156-Heterocapsa_arctica.AAC.1
MTLNELYCGEKNLCSPTHLVSSAQKLGHDILEQKQQDIMPLSVLCPADMSPAGALRELCGTAPGYEVDGSTRASYQPGNVSLPPARGCCRQGRGSTSSTSARPCRFTSDGSK